jgi:hypothetical protein
MPPGAPGSGQYSRVQWHGRGGAGLVSLISGEYRVYAAGGATGIYRASGQGYNIDGTGGEFSGDGTSQGAYSARATTPINGTGHGGSGGNGRQKYDRPK